jgi:predicted negative regulator of RcsB-dependent stress response
MADIDMAESQSEQKDSFGIEDVLIWVEQRRKQLLIATVVTVAAVAAIGIYNWTQQQKEADANAAVAAAAAGPVASEENKLNADALLKVANDFAGTSSAERALILAGSALYGQGKYADAQAAFAKFLGDHSGSQLSSLASIGLAVSLDAQGKSDEAIAKYEEITRNNVSGIGQVKLNLASLYEKQNKPAQALAVYESLVASQMGTGWASEAEDRKSSLLAQHPELAKAAPAPAAAASMTPAAAPPSATNSTKPKP